MNTKLLLQLIQWKKYNKLAFYTPYQYQQEFYDAGKYYNQRYMRAGNRTGKTYGASMEFAQHLTGDYQDWWNGRVIKDSGHTYWCIGVDLDSVSKVLQKELLGTTDIRQDDLIGTGAIPRDYIDFENITKDGPRVRTIFIKHKDGGFNTLHFYGANNEANLMGQAVKGVFLDEEPPYNSLEIYSQCVTRTATTDGFIIFTATPEQGQTALNDLFDNNEKGLLYLKSVGWKDCPHITDAIAEQLLAGIPDWQHDMRMNGLPVLGTGAVFPISDEAITEHLDIVPDHWNIVCAVDFGETTDASVIVFAAHNPDDDTYHLVHEIYLDQSIEARTPRNMAHEILNSEWPHAIVVVPHDGGLNSDDPQAKGKLLREYGCNVWVDTFRNPSDVKLGKDEIKTTFGSTHNGIHAGLIEMRRRFEENTLKVNQSMTNFFKEKRTYFWRENKVTRKRVATGTDHCIDASRYALMSLIGNISTDVLTAKKGEQYTWKQLQPSIRW